MISDHANHQNMTARRKYEQMGYKFSLGSDGWAVLLDADQVANGFLTRGIKGEQALREALDHAILAAGKHVAKMMKPVVAPVTASTKAQHKAVDAAVQFLVLAGAKYRIEFDGRVLTNMPEKAKRMFSETPRNNFLPHYGPPLDQFKGKGAFHTVLTLPKDLNFEGYVSVVNLYLKKHYGTGNYVVDRNTNARTLEIMVAAVKDDEA